jgi:3-oxoacyl-[acyl-carrier-protein] synthase II
MSVAADQIVLTGLGLSTCLGADARDTWSAVRAGRCGWGPLTVLEGTNGECHGGEAVALDPPGEGRREVRYLRRVVAEALRDAGVAPGVTYAPDRCASVLGTTLHGMRSAGEFLRGADAAVLADFLAAPVMSGALAGLPLTGPRITTCAACSSGLASVGLGMTLLAAGQADLVIVGGYDVMSEYAYAGFSSLRLIARGPVRPFSAGRDGMNIAEGYAALILERAADAARRGARPLVVVRAVAGSSDCHHLTHPHPQGEGAARAIRSALEAAHRNADAIGLVSAHATGTPGNDEAEYTSLDAVFGERLDRVPVVAFKSHLGHALGGAGAVELALTTLSLRDQVVPPTAGARAQDVEFPRLRLTSGAQRPAHLEAALSLSLGFGGANSAAVLSMPDQTVDAAHTPRTARKVLISGVGVVAPGAVGNTAFASLLAGPPAPLVRDPGSVDEASMAHLIQARRVRRMSEYVKLTLAAAAVALEDAGLNDLSAFGQRGGAILGTVHGSARYSEDYYRQIVAEGVGAANPMLFAEGVPNAAAAQLSMMLGVKGPCQTLIGSRTVGLDALWLAALRIATGQWDRAIVGAGEEYSPLVNSAYQRQGLTAGGPAAPFSGSGVRTGACAVAMLLESAESVESRGGCTRGSVLAGRSASGMGPAAAARAARSALLAIGAPDHVLCSATGCWLDRAEAAAIGSARRGRGPAVISTPGGYLGETFSAGPLAGIAGVLLRGALPAMATVDGSNAITASDGSHAPDRFGALCTDWWGSASAVCIGIAAPRRERARDSLA